MWEEPTASQAFDPLAMLGGPQAPAAAPVPVASAAAPQPFLMQSQPATSQMPGNPQGMAMGMPMAATPQAMPGHSQQPIQPMPTQPMMQPQYSQPMMAAGSPSVFSQKPSSTFGVNPMTRSDAFNFVASEMHPTGSSGFSSLLGGQPTAPAPQASQAPQAQPNYTLNTMGSSGGGLSPTRGPAKPASGGAGFGFMKGGDAFSFVADEVDKNKAK